ncbi:hypothetical protein MKW98_008365 [Papaver atlanticum]|uniref:UBX domain-containing protein n=1 Tax=Papaver atlanticum TaxID=357466 RepID=A0AAD4SE98_9MAGN|nr:hypothetical protein MKW98_008365 [Papaver atlanticum]
MEKNNLEKQELDEQEELENINDDHEDPMISSFLEIVVGQSVHTAIQYLQEAHWNVEDAISLYFSQQEMSYPEVLYENNSSGEANIRAEMEHPDVLAVDNFEDDDDDSLPLELMYQGPFHEAKQAAETQDRWLIVNVQSKDVFDSYALNMHTWAHKAVSQTIDANFIFWQVYDDTTEGQKVCNYYKLTSFPAVLVLDPITGQNMKSWSGMIEVVQLLEDLATFMDAGPKHHLTQQTILPDTTGEDEELLLAILASMENMTATVALSCSDSTDEPVTSSSNKLTFPDLPEEPKVEKTLLCRIGVRLPDGRRLQRNFLRTDPLQLLWSFCNSQLDGAESRPFHLTQAIPGASKTLDYESKQTFQESGLSNSMISVTWD